MADFLLHQDATVLCEHAGPASPVQVDPRVQVGGKPIVTQSSTYNVDKAICKLPPQSGGPCVTATWLSGAQRVRAGGRPVLLKNSKATCQPTLSGLNIVATQQRVKGT